MLTDSFKHKGLRKKLVDVLIKKGIQDEQVLAAIGKIPRHYFLDAAFEEFAYQDKAFPIGSGQTISQPYTVAFQTQLLQVKRGDKILEIGTGSGYQASVLVEMGAKVYSIERQRSLYLKTKQFLSEINYFPKLFYGDGYKGLPTYAPFDKIIITAGAPKVPEALLQQIKIGGILLIPIGEDVQTMTTFERISQTEFHSKTHGSFKFVPMLDNKN